MTPEFKPRIKPIGIGDLMVQKQKLIKYAPGEVAHIETVMATEKKSREHRRLRQTEETFTLEKEREEENTHDLKSTERFELQRESQKTIKSDSKWEAGADISAKYGPVKAHAFTKFSGGQSSKESNKNATNYAKEITERSLSKIVERVREERTVRILEEVEEKNLHSFDNTSGGNKSGIFRWVDKFYRNKVVNYGKRLFYEFMIPEPAANYIYSHTDQHEANALDEPEKPKNDEGEDLGPADILPENYLSLVSENDAEGVTAPPLESFWISKVITREFEGIDLSEEAADQFRTFSSDELEIPSGYKSGSQFVSWRAAERPDAGLVDRRLSGSGTIGKFDFGIYAKNVVAVIVRVRVRCELTRAKFEEWQLNTYSAIMTAYHKKKQKFEEDLAAAELQEGIKIEGRNPNINRNIEREELKKGCITLWTGLRFQDLAPGIFQPEGQANRPEIWAANVAETEESIKFMEMAFEWDNMSYEFFPYYWGRDNTWNEKITQLEGQDPLFQDFRRAGAACVRVPVKLAYTEAVLYLQLTGFLWTDGEIPAFSPRDPGSTFEDPNTEDERDEEFLLYLDYVNELRSEEAIDTIDKDVEINEDDPDTWEIKVPTDLVWLQEDQSLPNLEEE